MQYDDAQAVDQICYSMKLADYPRALNRTLINGLFNGLPPYSDDEVARNNININVNDLESTRLSHDARSQFYQAFLKPGNYFTLRTDYGVKHKRSSYSSTVTREMNRIMKRSLPYTECFRSKFAMNVLHGIAPAGFEDADFWCPQPFGVEDVMIPANTKLTMKNLTMFAIHRSFTGPELIRLTRGSAVDPGWNKDMVTACLAWIDEQSQRLMGGQWPDVWSPEKLQERMKGDNGYYCSDAVPTIEVWDFYYWNDDDNKSGWNRRTILDAWSTPTMSGGVTSMSKKSGSIYEGKSQFLYNPGDRKWADRREEIINWQFADLSAVAPFHYHTVRALGFLLYSVCHLQNRMRCKFSEAVFEQMMIYFRVKSSDDVQRALNIELAGKGFIDDSVEFIKAQDRYQINAGLVELGLNENRNLIARNSSSYTTNPTQNAGSEVEKTKFQVMAETNAITSLVSAGLLQAYLYQIPEYREILRRFCRQNSKDPDVVTFRKNCLRQGVPEKLLDPECWELEPERVMGSGNKTLEMAIAQQLMQYRNLYDPEPQRQILRDVTLAITDDPARADALVPDNQVKVSDSVHDAQLSAGSLMMGIPVAIKTGMNHIEYVNTQLPILGGLIDRVLKFKNGVPTPDEMNGLSHLGAHINAHIAIIGQDPEQKMLVKQYNDQLGKLMNEVKAFGQRLQQQMEKNGQQMGENGTETQAETAAKIQAMKITADAKAASTRESHAQRTTQRQLQFEQQQEQDRLRTQQELKNKAESDRLDMESQMAQAKLDAQIAHQERRLEFESKRELLKMSIAAEKEKAKEKAKAAKAAAKKKPKKD